MTSKSSASCRAHMWVEVYSEASHRHVRNTGSALELRNWKAVSLAFDQILVCKWSNFQMAQSSPWTLLQGAPALDEENHKSLIPLVFNFAPQHHLENINTLGAPGHTPAVPDTWHQHFLKSDWGFKLQPCLREMTTGLPDEYSCRNGCNFML